MNGTEFHVRHLIDIQVTLNLPIFKQRNQCKGMSQTEIDQTEVLYYTTSLSPSSLFPVHFKLETINGQTPEMFATTSSSTGIGPGISVLVTERYYLLTGGQATVTFFLHGQTGKGTPAGDQCNYLQ